MGPSFNWNILNYGRLVNNIRVQDARFQQLAYQYQNTVLQANAEAENALVGFLKFQQQVKYLATSTNAAAESLGLVRDQYNAGKTDFNRVLNVEQFLTQQQDQLAVAQGAVANNLVLLYKALGGGWQIRFGAPAESQPNAMAGQSVEPVPANSCAWCNGSSTSPAAVAASTGSSLTKPSLSSFVKSLASKKPHLHNLVNYY